MSNYLLPSSIDADPNYTVVEYLDDHSGYRCGYCKSPNSNFSHGMWAHRMKVGHYQELIDRGWRRSGKYCYKPTMDKICCPQYTIRCDSSEFKLSNSQKKVLKRMHHYLSHGSIKAQEKQQNTDSHFSMKETAGPSLSEHIPANVKHKMDSDISAMKVSSTDIANAKGFKEETSPPVQTAAGTSNCDIMQEAGKAKKAKLCQSTTVKQRSKGNEAKSLEDYLNESLPKDAHHKLEIRLVPCDRETKEFRDTFTGSWEVYAQYQKTIHGDPDSKCGISNFTRFLCESPLKPWNPACGPRLGYGTFHQQYWLDSKLIAVGVLDILPHCISSVYLYYDPKYSFLSLGTYASLREIALTRMFNRKFAELRWYYLGFYIHSCSKMRYKGNYHPSFLLCPETNQWNTIEKCLPKLDASKYARFADATVDKEEEEIALDKVLCLYRSNAMLFKDYRKKHKCAKEELDTVSLYAKNIGQVCASSMLLYRDD